MSIVVVGAGPAGLAAAAAALRRGAEVTLIDSAAELGGQYWRQLPTSRPSARPAALQHGWRRYRRLVDAITGSKRCRIITRAQVWAIDADRRLQLAVGPADGPDRKMITISAEALVLATGAHDLTLPFPGWDLPGVYTGGAAQALAKAERVAIGERVLVAGTGPFLFPVSTALLQAGAGVVSVHEAAGRLRCARGWLPHAPWLAPKAAELAGHLRRQLGHRVRLHTSSTVVAAHGAEVVEAVTVAEVGADWRPIAGTEQQVAVDAVCVSHGFLPRAELAVAADCVLEDGFVITDAAQRTSTPGVYAAGEVTGIAGSDTALAEGEVAGHLAAGGALTDAELRSARRRRRQYAHIATALRRAHAVGPGWTDWLTEDTVICRCEEVDYRRLCAARDNTETTSLRSLKLSSRAGLGPCQGRICGTAVRTIGSAHGEFDDDATFDRRPIATPIRFCELAALSEQNAPGRDRNDDTKGS